MNANQIELRPSVRQFAELMEEVLRANDHKGGWDECHPLWLFAKLGEEVGEVGEALVRLYKPDSSFNLFAAYSVTEEVRRECADAANVLHMIAESMGDYNHGSRGTEKGFAK